MLKAWLVVIKKAARRRLVFFWNEWAIGESTVLASLFLELPFDGIDELVVALRQRSLRVKA